MGSLLCQGENYSFLRKKSPDGDFLYLFVHGAGIVLADIVGNQHYFHSHGTAAKGNLDLVAHFHILAGLNHTTVDADAAVIAGFVGYCAPLDEPGDLQILV